MTAIIRNLFIIRNSILLLNVNFGECHSLGTDENLIASFISAIDILANEATGHSINKINFESYIFHFYNDNHSINKTFILIADSEENKSMVNFKIKKIASLFNEKYAVALSNFIGEVSQFNDFKQVLIEMNLAQKNCGGRPECVGCPNSAKSHKLLNLYERDNKGFLHGFRNMLK